MTENTYERLNRRSALKVFAAGGTLAVAGCVGGDDGTDEEEDPDTDDGMDDTEADDDGMDDTERTEETESFASTDPSPTGQSLAAADILALVDIFDDQPMNDDQHQIEGENRSYTPRHVWKWVTEETFIGLHFNDPNPEQATELDYITIGKKGLFTEESRPGEEFSHFHQHTAESWDAGHGGDVGDEGYWLTHIAVREIQYPFHADPIEAQVDYGFFPTPPEPGTEGHTTDFTSPGGGEGSLSAADRDALLDVFTDQTMNDDQHVVDGDDRSYTPRHVWKWVSEDTFLFLHFNDPNPEQATELDYFGMGVRGQFDAESVPTGQEAEFSHFHKHESASWDAGHGAQDASQWGYWLVHHTVRPVQYPFHDEPTDVGVDSDFFPTPLE